MSEERSSTDQWLQLAEFFNLFLDSPLYLSDEIVAVNVLVRKSPYEVRDRRKEQQ